MSFHLILLLILIAAAIHILRLPARSTARAGEIILVWLLVGYCGVPMMGFMGFGLMHPAEIAHLTGFPPGSPFQAGLSDSPNQCPYAQSATRLLNFLADFAIKNACRSPQPIFFNKNCETGLTKHL